MRTRPYRPVLHKGCEGASQGCGLDGAKFAVEEFKKQGIDIDVVWDAPPQANIDDQNRRIEAAIGHRPDALCVASLDPSTNVQILEEARRAGYWERVVVVQSFSS